MLRALAATGGVITSAGVLLAAVFATLGVLPLVVLAQLGVVICVGFSVDYVVHLSADYMHSPHTSRHDKIKQAYSEMGVSVLSGAITTFGSGVFLFGGQILFFPKFALMICSTITLGFLSSMLLFGALMHTLGPENGFGNVRSCLSQKKGE